MEWWCGGEKQCSGGSVQYIGVMEQRSSGAAEGRSA